MSTACKRSAGFTLVELLVVIGIIAVLIGILLPSLNKARSQAKSVQCQANLRSIGQAISIYTATNKGVLPYGFAGYTNSAGQQYVHWAALLIHTMDPKMDFESQDSWKNANTANLRKAFYCPEVPSDSSSAGDSGIIHYLCHPRIMPQLGTNDVVNPGKTLQPYKQTHIRRSSEIGLIFDGSLAPSGDNIWKPASGVPVANVLDSYRIYYGTGLTDNLSLEPARSLDEALDLSPNGNAADKADVNKDNSSNQLNIRFRHRKDTQSNVLFADGHVDGFAMKGQYTSEAKRRNFWVTP